MFVDLFLCYVVYDEQCVQGTMNSAWKDAQGSFMRCGECGSQI